LILFLIGKVNIGFYRIFTDFPHTLALSPHHTLLNLNEFTIKLFTSIFDGGAASNNEFKSKQIRTLLDQSANNICVA